MKYPLAIVKRLLDQYGSDIGLGYDIMCAFITTLAKSSLGSRMVGLNLKGVVPAFHGHAHNRACQVHWHPMYMEGVGIEDFEECERTFAKSNDLAAVTRLATPFHRHQQIEEYFKFHDADKHASSGMPFTFFISRI
jgi:Kyakuja-Dileera-Zisupton transposase